MPSIIAETGTAGAVRVAVAGRPLACPVCGNDNFEKRRSLLNTRKMTFFNVDFLNRAAVNYICGRCGYVYWFMERK